MCPAFPPRLPAGSLFLLLVPLAGLGCGGNGGTDVVLPSLSVSTTTTGVELDPDGYGVQIDGQAVQPIGAQATLTVDRLVEGQHTVALSGLAPNCAVEGENPRPVGVTAEATATVAFEIICGAATGAIRVSTATTGAGTDPDGFALLLDGGNRGGIGLSGEATLSGLTPGSYTVGLTGVAANCQVAGENPRSAAVTAGETAQVAFAVTCATPGPTIGALEITVATSGVDPDPDGYQLTLDGGASQPIGVNATLTLANLSATEHTIQLLGVASNCTVAGTNPARTSIPSGGTARIAFTVNCSARPEGSIQVSATTSGSSIDTDGYTVSVDGGTPQAITVNGSRTFANLPAGMHSVQLSGVAANCQVSGDNPVGVAVASGETASVTFSVNCGATLGQLAVTITGLPSGAQAAVTVSGPNNFSQALTATRTLTGLTPGSYAVSAANVVSGGTTYIPSASRPAVDVAAGGTAAVSVSYTAEAGVTLNLRIDGLYLTQSTQTYGSDVPLVAGRDGFLRVFVVANETNTAKPRVRVRLSRPGAATQTLSIAAQAGSTPTQVQEATLGSSWNLPIPASLIQPGLSIVADVDPGEELEESNEGDNRFPASGAKALTVRSVAPAAIRFVRVLQTANNLEGVVGSTEALMSLARRIYPLNSVQADVRQTVFSTDGPLLRNGEGGWNQLLSDLDAARVAEAPDRMFFGIVKLDYGLADGVLGVAFQGVPTALGWDDPGDASRVVAHELGHNWGRRHSPCGGPSSPSLDHSYPYPGGQIGVYGMDVGRTDLKPPSSPDIMGYCLGPWISDYTYRQVMAFREASAAGAAVALLPQPSVLVWGRIVNGQPVLEPAFHIVTRSSLPSRPGPYSVTATGLDGSQLFKISFEAATTADDPGGNGHFAFAVPLDPARANRLASLRLAGPGGFTAAVRAPADLRRGTVQESIVARREGQTVALRWNASAHPTIMVRDPDTGEVLSFARGGTARVWTSKSEVDLEVSDGVRSQRARLAINRP